MDSKFLNRVILGLVFATLGTETIATQAATVTEDCPGSVMPVNGVVKSTDGDLNFKTFDGTHE